MARPMFRLSVEHGDFTKRVARLRVAEQEKMRMVSEAAAIEVIAFLRSLTDELRPPAKTGEPMRRAHPGHWADVRGHLANSYYWRVTAVGIEVHIVLGNSAEYAIHLERREGFYVIRGAVEPFRRELRRAAARLAPSWEVR